MESWSFDSMDNGFVLNETISPSHSSIRDKNILMGWDLKPSFSFGNSVFVPIQNSVHNSSFLEVGIADMIRKQFPHNSTSNVLGDNAGVGDIISPSLANSNVISGDEESSSRFSSSVMDSNSRESSLIDLKLGGFGDKPHSNSTSTANILSSADSSAPSKRARVKSLNSQTAYCQVYGCQKDLSSAKDYHRRHKVCDVHSKTSKVIVNGVEQRFCQQCSRFHLLGEFDDAKRSCRKRLAGHNERRRKPQLGFSSRNGRSFHSTGSNFQEFTPSSTSFNSQGMLPRGTSHADMYVSNDWVKHIKVENETAYALKPTHNCLYGKLQPKPNFPSYIFEKRFPIPDNTNNTGPQNVFGEDVTHYMHPTVSHSMFHTNSPGSENLTLLDAASTIKGLPGISESGCALSLLSSQLRKSSGHASQIPEPEVHPLIIPSGSPHYIVNEVSEIFSGIQNRNSLCRANATGRNQQTSMLTHNDADTPHLDFGNVMDRSSKLMNIKDQWSCDVGTTIDLLQLSTQLQQVENQRQPEPLKHETKVSAV